jgi:hypothetical protein
MSAVHNPVQRHLFAAQASLIRLRLLCRFDFRQKIWVLRSSEFPRERKSILPADSGALASAISKNYFSDPSLGGANLSKPFTRRIGIRRLPKLSLGKTKSNKGKMKLKNYSSAILAAAVLGSFVPFASAVAASGDRLDGGTAAIKNIQPAPEPQPVVGALLVGGIGLLAIMKLRRNTS